jgi:hypothetical protein
VIRRLVPVLKVLAYVVVIAFLGYQLWRVRHGIGPSLAEVGWRSAVLATGLAAVGGIPGFIGWRMLLTGLDVRLPLLPSIQVYFLAGLTRYLPGGVWPALAHAAQAKPLGVPPARMAGAYLATQGIGVIAGLVVGLIALPALVVASPLWLLLVPVVVLALVPVAVPRLLGPVLTLAQRLVRRGERTPPVLPDRRTLASVTWVMAVGWLISGLQVAVLAIALGAPVGSALTVGVGGFALSVVGGIVAIILPSGLGARELVLGLTLAGLLSGSALITVVALSRVLITAGDLLSTAAVLGLLTISGRARAHGRPLEGASS